jgi:hypothetical protein
MQLQEIPHAHSALLDDLERDQLASAVDCAL